MRKFADKYLETADWGIAESGFHPAKSRVSESLFALANEHMGVRAHFEEGYSGDTLVGSYVNVVFEELKVQKSYKGIADSVRFIVNAADWTRLSLSLDGERLDLAAAAFRDFRRELDFRSGLLRRSFVWTAAGGRELEVGFERFLSMDEPELGYQRLTLKPLNFSGAAELEAGVDFSALHEVYRANHWKVPFKAGAGRGAAIHGETVSTGKGLTVAFALAGDAVLGELVEGEKYVGRRATVKLARGEAAVVYKTSRVQAHRSGLPAAADLAGLAAAGAERLARAPGFADALDANRRYWARVWETADIAIEGDPENQQGIRFGLFQLEQTYRGLVPGANIGAKGLTGEFYNGNAFWDSEVYCLPYYLYQHPAAAKALVRFRYDTLPQARSRAKDLDCAGACFPLATIDGTECCTLWQHASLQLQPTTSVAFALAHYLRASGDTAFLHKEGAELMAEIARFLASRCQWSERKRSWGYYAVMGPDEFQMMVNHNAYTNFMGARSLEFAVETLNGLKKADPAAYAALAAKIGLEDGEIAAWAEVAAKMYVPREGNLIEQHEGFFDLPHVDIKAIPPEEFPLYHHWSYDRIYRNDMIKQPDVLMMLFLYSGKFTTAEKRAGYEYYEPRTIHESSLSPSVHSILAAELGRKDEAYEFFKFATRIDLDDYNRNAREGLHLTAIAAAWMNIVYGFAGFRSDGPVFRLAPYAPDAWKSYRFKLRLAGGLVEIKVDAAGAALALLEGGPVEFELYGRPVRLAGPGEVVRGAPPAGDARNGAPA
jgi:maltose phosphorylase